jgi:hypothetical protein
LLLLQHLRGVALLDQRGLRELPTDGGGCGSGDDDAAQAQALDPSRAVGVLLPLVSPSYYRRFGLQPAASSTAVRRQLSEAALIQQRHTAQMLQQQQQAAGIRSHAAASKGATPPGGSGGSPDAVMCGADSPACSGGDAIASDRTVDGRSPTAASAADGETVTAADTETLIADGAAEDCGSSAGAVGQ